MGGAGQSDRARPAPRSWLVLLAIAAAVIVPFLLFGERLEGAAETSLQGAAARPWLAAGLIVALLGSDVVLPIPSSIVGVFAGATLGVVSGTAAIWCGLMLGCVIGYGIGRLVPERALAGPSPWLGAVGPLMLAATRAVPVLAETGIIAAGAARLGFGQVVAVTALANLLVAFAYAGAGAMLAALDPLLVAIISTVGLSLAWGLWLLARRPRAT